MIMVQNGIQVETSDLRSYKALSVLCIKQDKQANYWN